MAFAVSNLPLESMVEGGGRGFISKHDVLTKDSQTCSLIELLNLKYYNVQCYYTNSCISASLTSALTQIKTKVKISYIVSL